MANTDIKYPNYVQNTSGGHYRTFRNLNNLKHKNNNYAINQDAVQPKNQKYNRPSAITVKDFRFGLPSNAKVTKIIVNYKHARVAACTKNNTLQPCPENYYPCNPGAPTLSLQNISGSKKGVAAPVYKSTTKGGKTTYSKPENHTVTFTGEWNAAQLNSANFGVKVDYPANANTKDGYMMVYYINVKLVYYTPSYSINLNKVKGGYNHEDYVVRASITNKNPISGSPSSVITAPIGFTFKEAHGGSAKMVSGRVVEFKPSFKKAGTSAVELVFTPNVTYAPGSSSYTGTFTMSLSSANLSKSLSATIVDKPIDPTSVDGGGKEEFYDDTTEYQEVKSVVVDEEFDYTFSLSEAKLEEILHTVYDYGLEHGWWSGTYEEIKNTVISNCHILVDNGEQTHLSKNQLLLYKFNASWVNYPIGYQLNHFISFGGEVTFHLKGIDKGYDEISLRLRASVPNYSGNSWMINTWRFNIKPQESSLTTPNYTRLSLGEEELDRLGHSYGYTVQADMKLDGYSEYYTNNSTNSLTYSTSPYYYNTKNDAGPLPKPPQFVYECDFKTTGTQTRIFLTDIPLENITPSTFPEYSLFFGVTDGNLSCGRIEKDVPETIIGDAATTDTYYHIRLEYNGTEVACYVDDTLLGTLTCNWMQTVSNIYVSLMQIESGTVTCKDRVMWFGEGETYVRDWYKNFRIGVFNNRIEENCTDYLNYETEETEVDVDLKLPSMLDLTDAVLTVSADNPVNLCFDGETIIPLTSSYEIPLTDDYIYPVTVSKENDDTATLTLQLTKNNEVLSTTYYNVKFEQAETKAPYESTVDTTDYDNLTDVQIYENAKYWATNYAGLNEYNTVECEFTYNKNYPLYVLMTGDYPEGEQANSTITFDEPCIIEDYTERKPNGTYPLPIDAVVDNEDGNISELTLGSYTATDTIVLYDLPLEQGYGTNEEMAVRGIEITGEIERTDQLIITAILKSPTGESKQRSIILDDFELGNNENIFHIGGVGDLWGFRMNDITNLEDWEAYITIANNLSENDGSINFTNTQIIFYIEQIEKQNVRCSIDGEDIGYYGVFLTDLKIPEGLETDTDYLKIDGTDTNDAYRQNIKEKEIEIEFEIGDGCNLELSTYSLREFTKLLVNDRDEYNRPIPKTIEFSHYPDVYWEYIMEDAIDPQLDINTYKCKVKLTIPAGTSYDKDDTTTSNTGYVNGIANVNPIIIVKPTEATLEIEETQSGQKFNMGYGGDWTNQILEINCEDRTVTMKQDEDSDEETDLTAYVDYNSDWFILKGEYEFSSINCVIRTIKFTERW